MKREKWLYGLLGVLFITYVMVEYYKPRPLDWTVTFAHKDKNPYGSFILYDRLEDLFLKKSLSFQTLYELEDADTTGHLLILATNFNASESDLDAIFHILEQGKSIAISAQSFSHNFLDTLGLKLHFRPANVITNDTIPLTLQNESYRYPATFVNSWFTYPRQNEWSKEAMDQEGHAVVIKKNFGKANLILSSTPLAFTNYGLLFADNHRYVSAILRLMSNEKVTYTRFYHSGKPEPATPLRYMLSQAPLRWAVYLTLLVLALYLIISSRRVQRVIPVLDPVKNTTVAFIKTIGGLYHREGNNKNAADKLINHFHKTLSEKYYIRTFDEAAYPVLAAKSGVPVDVVIETFNLIRAIRRAERVPDQHLKQLYDQISLFKIY